MVGYGREVKGVDSSWFKQLKEGTGAAEMGYTKQGTPATPKG